MPKKNALLIFGGTFNPIHLGHIGVAGEVAKKLGISKIRIIPNGDPPHRDKPKVSANDRLWMLETTLSDLDSKELCFEVDAIEINRIGKSYTHTTLSEIRKQNPESKLYLLLGQDAFDHFHSWYQPDDIATLCDIVVINRPGSDSGEINEANKSGLTAVTLDRVQFIEVTPHDISSTRIRSAFAVGDEKSIRRWLNRRVFQYIKEQKFYVE